MTAPSKKTICSFSLSEETVNLLYLLALDPVTRRAKYGLKSEIVEDLLWRFVHAVSQGKTEIDIKALIHKLNKE